MRANEPCATDLLRKGFKIYRNYYHFHCPLIHIGYLVPVWMCRMYLEHASLFFKSLFNLACVLQSTLFSIDGLKKKTANDPHQMCSILLLFSYRFVEAAQIFVFYHQRILFSECVCVYLIFTHFVQTKMYEASAKRPTKQPSTTATTIAGFTCATWNCWNIKHKTDT